MLFRDRLRAGVVLFDGAMGTQLQALALPADAWDGREGCSEVLNLTRPDDIVAIHGAYLDAGSDVVETNSFGANSVVLAEYGLADRVEELNRLAVELARRAIEQRPGKPRFVAGSMGPGTKLASLGQADYATLYQSYRRQARGLLDGGADLLLIETCQDPLQIKAAVGAARETVQERCLHVPIAVTVTVETTGTLLVGTEVEALLAILAPFDIDILGLNCATGPVAMRPHAHTIAQQFMGPVLVQPNAGLPQNVEGRVAYPLRPDEFAAHMVQLIGEEGVTLVGGCCGTTPAHIARLAARLADVTPAVRAPSAPARVASLFRAQTIRQEPAPFFIGERLNANGSKQFRDCLLRDDRDGMVAIAREQERSGAHGIDLCVAYTGRAEAADMVGVVSRLRTQSTLPLVIDSTDVAVLEQALALYGGRATINSINLEAGEARADAICRLARQHGAALIALTIDEQGMAMTVERKLEVAHRLHDIAVKRHGLHPHDLIFDTLTFTLGSGDATLRDAAVQTLEAIRRLKRELPGVATVLGVSNISFGLSPASREVLNAVFLHEAVAAGLDMAIVNAAKIVPLHRLDSADRAMALDLVHHRGDEPLRRFIDHFAARSGQVRAKVVSADLPLDERLQQKVIDGDGSDLAPLLERKRGEWPALRIINGLLIPAMRRVGELFGAGELQLPFVLQSAEVMKQAVDLLRPHLERHERATAKSLVLATVRGDVHDIGKNLVDIILSNNGYTVHNLGINCDVAVLLAKADEVNADAIGLSGLLVKSTVVMRENLLEMKRRGLTRPVLLGGAALTADFVAEQCAPELDAPVVYCSDAFAGLQAMERLTAGTLADANAADQARVRARRQTRPQPPLDATLQAPLRDASVPTPPFLGTRVLEGIDLMAVYGYLNEEVVMRGRWGYRRGALSKEAYDRLIVERVRPELEALKARCSDEGILAPRAVYGYFACRSEGEQIVILDAAQHTELARLRFPRQQKAPHRCIADFFRSDAQGPVDLIALQVVTVGPRASELEQELYAQGHYKDYLLLHGLAVEVAEAAAEWLHQRVRRELGIASEDGTSVAELAEQRYRGARYSFGYPACPDLDENRTLLRLLEAERIGVSMTSSGEMVPEQTTSAFVVHHPQAKYFTLT